MVLLQVRTAGCAGGLCGAMQSLTIAKRETMKTRRQQSDLAGGGSHNLSTLVRRGCNTAVTLHPICRM